MTARSILTQRLSSLSRTCGYRQIRFHPPRILNHSKSVSILSIQEIKHVMIRSTSTLLPVPHNPSRHCICSIKQHFQYYNTSLSKHYRHCCSSASVSQNEVFYPRRAVMYVPASDERKTKKAASLNVDTLVFDLEDGVAVNQKVCIECCVSFKDWRYIELVINPTGNFSLTNMIWLGKGWTVIIILVCKNFW